MGNDSVAAKNFFKVLSRWSRPGGGCRSFKTVEVRKLHSQPHRSVLAKCRPLVAAPQRASFFGLFGGSSKPQASSLPPEPPQDASLSERVRHIMRSVPAPIVVLTTTLLTPTAPRQVPRGMTLSSFTTISLDPEPIVTFNIKSELRYPSRTLLALEQTGAFNVHILTADEEGAAIASNFTKPDKEDNLLKKHPWIPKSRVNADQPFALPTIGGPGVKRVLTCEVLGARRDAPLETLIEEVENEENVEEEAEEESTGLIRVGDHVLVLARVTAILDVDPEHAEDQPDLGLTYVNGQFREAGDAIELEAEDQVGKNS